MTREQRIEKLKNGSDTAKWAAAEIERLRSALEIIERWHGEFPETGQYWDPPKNSRPMSYRVWFGSNGERDYMRQVAREALAHNA